MDIRVQAAPFDVCQEFETVKTRVGPRAGAIVTFTGLMREMSADRPLQSMTLEHYPAMTLRELERIGQEAQERWHLEDLTLIHRYGTLTPGEEIVLVITAAQHRQAAFEAASYLMDFLKVRAPFWKKETPASQEESEGHWVDARESDDEAVTRWRK
jgi:molybdopterin synthase catalytic subunit